MRRVLILLSAVLLLLVAVVPAAAAGGDADCSDFTLVNLDPPVYVVEDQVIEGSLYVPPGVGCVVVNSMVEGDVLASEGALFTEIVEGSMIDGNVHVPGGTTATLFQAHVAGNYICDGCVFEDVFESTVDGNVEIVGEEDGTWIIDSNIGGNILIKDSRVEFVAFWVKGTTVGGNVEIIDSKGPVYVFDNTVSGNVSIVANKMKSSVLFPGEAFFFPWVDRETFKKAEIIGNEIGGNLEYKDNRGGKADISDNTIAGNLTCDGNKRTPIGGGNTADQLEGQCSNL